MGRIVTTTAYVPRLAPALARADVVHVFGAAYAAFLAAPLPALLAARAFRRPVVLNYHNGEASDHLRHSPIARAAIRAADRVVVPSQYLVNVLSRFGVSATPIANIIDLERFRYRERVPIRPRLLSTRNLHALYNVACTVRAFRLIQDRWPDASLTIAGGGPQEPMLRSLVATLRLDHVSFVGRVAPADIAAYYASHDIYIQSPNADNLPNSVFEAFASGLPVVSTEAGGVPAMLRYGDFGSLAPVDDHRALAKQVLHLLDEPEHARRTARAAYESCRTFSWPSVRREWLRVYGSVLES
jgi:glycosyltransferase involved in cell wall biosynthesis